jgi:hypothetical protein
MNSELTRLIASALKCIKRGMVSALEVYWLQLPNVSERQSAA